MFNQTFVDGTQKTRKPYTVLLSLALQISALCTLILIPLFYTEALPGAQLKSMLMAPPPPPRAPLPSSTAKTQTQAAIRQLHLNVLTAPRFIPNHVNRIQEIAPAEIGVPGAVGEPDANGTGVANLLWAVPNNPPPPPPPAPKPNTSRAPVKIGGVVAQANLIRQVQPVYPPLAKAARIQGTVEFAAIISKEGNIEHLELVHGHPLLVNAARDAVLQWKYRPTLLNGEPVEVSTQVVVKFTLAP
ncbi:MAG: energy transducer TonB [Acidobacteriaceae bacterium]|nr:energy transducer TonB [Acidobacteriaceae bacterium]